MNAKEQNDEVAQKQMETVYQWFQHDEASKGTKDFLDIRNSDEGEIFFKNILKQYCYTCLKVHPQ